MSKPFSRSVAWGYIVPGWLAKEYHRLRSADKARAKTPSAGRKRR